MACRRAKLAATEALVNGVPSWNLTFGCNWKV